MSRGPVFLERESYRRRRLTDAVRLLPLLGVLLWMVPLIWPVAADQAVTGVTPEAMPTSTALLYIFGVWVLLVVIGWLLWRRTGTAEGDAKTDTLG